LEVQAAFNSALSEISQLEAKGLYSKVKFLSRGRAELVCSDGARIPALSAKMTFDAPQRGSVRSYLAVFGCKGAIFKLRMSLQDKPGSEAALDASYEKALAALGQLLNRGNATSVDPDLKESVLNAVKALEDDPAGSGMMALPAVFAFARDSEDVNITLSPAVLPWLKDREKPAQAELLLGAYIGGSVRSQLQRNVREDSPVDGLRCLFTVYKKLRASGATAASPEIEKLMKLDAEGSLAKELDLRLGKAKAAK